MKNVLPGQEVPTLIVNTVNGMKWDLRDQQPKNFTLLVFYRGLHCPVCKSYLEEINKKISKFHDNGVNVICISANKLSLAEDTVMKWDIEKLNIGYGFSVEDARKWDLYISKGMNEKEPNVFFEPALFLVNPDNTLYAAAIQSMPFARPSIDDLIKSTDYIVDHHYPARGKT
jgi:peroxiredoxin